MAARLGAVCCDARIAADLRMIDIATAVHMATGQRIDESTISLFERGVGWRRRTDEIVAAYEHECRLSEGTLWRRAAGC